jgi:PAS domain S-box-containing protein
MSGNSSERISRLHWYSIDLPMVRQITLRGSIILVFVISFLDLAGWLFNIPLLKSIMPFWTPMKIITAICFIFIAIALFIIQSNLPDILRKILPRIIATFIFLISLITLYVYQYSKNYSHESSLTGISYLAFILTPEMRMALLTAINLFLISCILFLLSASSEKASGIAHIIIIPVTLVSYFITVSYILNIYSYDEFNQLSVALNSSIAFLGICIAVLIMRPDTWLLKVFSSGNLGGYIARKLIPAVIIIPIVIGWFRIRGEWFGFFESEKGVILVAVTYTICFLILVWFLARRLTNIDRKRIIIEEALHESEKHYRELAENIPDILIRYNRDLKVLYRNPASRRLIEISTDEFNNKPEFENDAPHSFVTNWEKEALEVFKSGKICRMEQTKNLYGEEKVFDVLIVPEHAGDGGENNINVDSIISIARDITEYKKAEDHLRYQSRMLGAVTDAIIGTDLSLNITYWNQSAEKIYGWKQEEVMGKPSKDILRSEITQEQREEILKEIIAGNAAYTELVQYTKDNQQLIIEGNTIPLMDANGNITSIVAINSNITQKKLAENIIRNSEQKLKYHLENSPLAVVEWDKDFHILQWSTEAERIFGLKKEEAIGARIDTLNLIFEEDIPLVQNTIERLASGKELKIVSHNRNYNKNREVMNCVWYNSVLLDNKGEMASVMSLVENITTLKRTETELIESKETYKELITNARSIIVKVDSEGKFTFINEFSQSFFGYSEEELLGKYVIDTIVPKTESTGRDLGKLVEDIFEDPDKFSMNINENKKKNGDRVWIDWRNKALYDQNGKMTGHIAIGIDITDRKKAEEELKVLEDKLWSVLNATQESIYMFDKEGKITMSNNTGLRRLHLTSPNELIGHYISEFMTPEIAESRQKNIDKVFSSGIPLEFEDKREGRIYHHNFSPVFKNEKVSFVVTYSTDITERKRAENKLKESEAQLKELNATKDKFFNIIAHDLKNPFTSLLGSSELLYNNINQMTTENIKKLTLILNDSAKGGFAILQNLLDWSRSQTGILKYNPERVNLKKLIDENISNLKLTATNKEIHLISETDENIFIIADKNMINTLLRNLLNNAIKFTHRNGKVIIEASKDTKNVFISVKDTGIGISEGRIGKLFRIDTKHSMPGTENEQGTGLGLKLCKEFVEKMGGKIWVKSIENRGSEFRFSIPIKES